MKLSIVPTPIGNLEDITIRALNVLRSADIILAEDTRTSGKLLKHFEVATKCWAYHMHNEHAAVASVIQEIKSGKKIALISDAGTPGISDPGFLLVRECIANDIVVECLPGATAFVPALVCPGPLLPATPQTTQTSATAEKLHIAAATASVHLPPGC